MQLSVIYTLLRASAESRTYTARAEGLMPRFLSARFLPTGLDAAIDLNDNQMHDPPHHSAPWIVE